MFIDETTITVKAGDGGNGCFAYERLKYKQHGRPDGGDGGRGGNVSVRGDGQMHTLQDAAYRKLYKADRGAHGKGSNKTGREGEDIVISIPLGTVVADADTGEVICDCVQNGREYLVARGGRGGKGNAALMSHRNPNPERALPGLPGEHRRLHLTLKVLADVGLVGRPNAGKSTFLSRISKARPKIADYPFTTTVPHLGIVSFPDWKSIVVADLPGLIEDSHTGKGLGIRFLRHIERTRALAIMVESLSEDPKKDARMLLHELKEYSPELAAKPHCFILTKTDLLPPGETPKLPKGWLKMSSVSGNGVSKVLLKFKDLCRQAHDAEEADLGPA